MKRERMFLAAAALALSIFAAGELRAQSVPGGFQSPTLNASFLFRGAADDFIRPDTYKNAGVENRFVMSAFANTNDEVANIGYARNFGGLYLAAYYGGTFWQNVRVVEYDTNDLTVWHDKESGNGKIKDYGSLPGLTGPADDDSPSNRFSLLLGTGDIGFRFSLYTTLNRFSGKDFIGEGAEYQSYTSALGVMQPQIALAMSKDLSENGVRPWLTFDLPFHRDYTRYTLYLDESENFKADGETVAYSENYVTPTLNAGLGGYNFISKDAFTATFDADYLLRFNSYNNDYNYEDADGNMKIGSYKGLNPDNTDFAVLSDVTNRLRPSVTGAWNWEKVSFKTRVYLPLELRVAKETPMSWTDGDETKGTLVQEGSETKTTVFTFSPSIDLGVQWEVTPKLTLLAGGRVAISTLGSITSTVGEEYENGKMLTEADLGSPNIVYTTTSSIRGNNPADTGVDTSTALRFGAVLNATDNLAVEAAMGVNTGYSLSEENAGTEGLFHFANILFRMRF